ncbi:hypothetical protein [Sphingomonas sp. 2378]|uniref:hypothetical protein n=1 Tax=Sphingomonas sp. 2378 TaxID=1219748 RepID=UPI00311AD593
MRDDPGWMSLGNMRANDVRRVLVWCGCGHSASVDADRWPDDRKVPGLKRHFRCTKCGQRPRMVVPDWTSRTTV